MRVFVAGGTGFIGRAVVRELLARGHKVVALVGARGAFEGVDGVEPVVGRIQTPHTYRGRALGCQAAIHLVGLLRASRSKYVRVVAKGTKAWVQECREAGIKHLVYVSAIGAGPEGTPYQRTKWTAEQAVRNSGVPYTILRPSFVIGPGGFLQQMRDLLRMRVMPVFGKQDYPATPVARDDLVAVIAATLVTPKARGRVFHVGGPDEVTYLEMVKTIRDASGIKAATPRLPKVLGYTMAGTLGLLPFFPANLDNLRMLFQGNVAPEHDWEEVFGLKAQSFDHAVRKAVAELQASS